MRNILCNFLLIPVGLAVLMLSASAPKARATAYGSDFAMTCYLDHSSFCMHWQATSVMTDRRQPALKATVTATKDLNATCVRGSMSITIDGQLIYTSPLLAAGTSVKNVDLGSYSPGAHRVEVSEAAYDGSACPNPEVNGSYYKYAIVVSVSPVEANAREFTVDTGTGAEIGERVSFSGRGWKGKGPPIRVRWGTQLIKSFPASKRFRGSFRLWDFPEKSFSACGGALTASQGGFSKSVNLTGAPDKYVYFASGIKRGDGKAIRSGAILCAGRGPIESPRHSWVWKSGLADSSKPGLQIDDSIAGVKASGIFFGPSGMFKLARKKGSDVTVSLDPSIGPSVSVDLNSFNVSGQPGVVQIVPSSLSGPVLLDSMYYSDHDLIYDGNVTLENGYLFAVGNVTINGALRGRGAIIATGGLTVNGPVDVASMALSPDGSGGITLLSGQASLLGR